MLRCRFLDIGVVALDHARRAGGRAAIAAAAVVIEEDDGADRDHNRADDKIESTVVLHIRSPRKRLF